MFVLDGKMAGAKEILRDEENVLLLCVCVDTFATSIHTIYAAFSTFHPISCSSHGGGGIFFLVARSM